MAQVWILTRYEWDSASGRETLAFVAAADSYEAAAAEVFRLEESDYSKTPFVAIAKKLEDGSTNIIVKRDFYKIDVLPTYNICEHIILE